MIIEWTDEGSWLNPHRVGLVDGIQRYRILRPFHGPRDKDAVYFLSHRVDGPTPEEGKERYHWWACFPSHAEDSFRSEADAMDCAERAEQEKAKS